MSVRYLKHKILKNVTNQIRVKKIFRKKAVLENAII